MPLRPYTVLTLFQSSSGFLAKVARSTAPRPGTCVEEWVWIEPMRAVTLVPLSRSDRLAFRECRLRLEDPAAELQWTNGRTDVLERVAPEALPPATHRLLALHFS